MAVPRAVAAAPGLCYVMLEDSIFVADEQQILYSSPNSLQTEVRMEEVRRIRRERELTQEQLADMANVDRASLSLIETGRRTPGIETLQKLADALGVEVADFFPRAQPDLFATAPAPPLDFAVMSRATPEQRRRALRAASDDGISRYRQSIDRALDNLEKWEAKEEGYVEQDQETLAAHKAFLRRLRAETDPFDVIPPTPRSSSRLVPTR